MRAWWGARGLAFLITSWQAAWAGTPPGLSGLGGSGQPIQDGDQCMPGSEACVQAVVPASLVRNGISSPPCPNRLPRTEILARPL